MVLSSASKNRCAILLQSMRRLSVRRGLGARDGRRRTAEPDHVRCRVRGGRRGAGFADTSGMALADGIGCGVHVKCKITSDDDDLALCADCGICECYWGVPQVIAYEADMPPNAPASACDPVAVDAMLVNSRKLWDAAAAFDRPALMTRHTRRIGSEQTRH